MKKKICLFAFMLCILSCGLILTACGGAPTLEFLENADLSKVYNGQAISESDVLEIVKVSENQDVTIEFYQGDTAVVAPTDAGDYRVVVSIPSKSIEDTFTISQKNINVNLSCEYNAGLEFAKTLTTAEGLCEGDNVIATATFTASAVDSTSTNIVLSGEDVANYSLQSANATIAPKEIGEIVFSSMWINKSGERTFTKALSTANGLIQGEVASIVVKTQSHDANAPITSIEFTGVNASNYTIKAENIKIRISVKLTLSFYLDTTRTINVYAVYGEDKLYKDALGANAFSMSEFTNLGVKVTAIYNTFDDGVPSTNEVVNVDEANFGKFIANAKYSASGLLTDSNGNWLINSGNNADALNLIANVEPIQ